MSRESLEKVVAEALDASEPDDRMLDERVEDVVNALIEAGGGEDHILMADPWGGFTIQHPITERFSDDLFSCRVFAQAQAVAAGGAFNRGTRHRLWTEDGEFRWEELS